MFCQLVAGANPGRVGELWRKLLAWVTISMPEWRLGALGIVAFH
jgi:hypothetical protein